MKRLILAAAALAALSVPAMAESPRHNDNHHAAPVQVEQHWRKGQRLSQSQRKHVVDYRKSHLHAPGRGQAWVQVDRTYVLINITTGVIASILSR